MSNITEFHEGLRVCYESLFEIRLQKKTASSESQKKALQNIGKEIKKLKAIIRKNRVAIYNAVLKEKK